MTRVGRFELGEELGRGGMGVVYRGRQPSLDRPVVLKRMRRDALAEPSHVARFERGDPLRNEVDRERGY